MAVNEYHFITNWRMESTVQEVSEVIGNGTDLVRWWPSVYLEVKELEKGDENGIGKVIDLYTKGWLPYTLRWRFRVVESLSPYGFTLEAWGDFVGRGIWTFRQDGKYVDITYDWKIRADKPLLKKFSFIMKPIFSANHRWAMAMGEQSLKLELARRHATSREELARIPAPPQPTTSSPVPMLLGVAGVSTLVGGFLYFTVKNLRNK
jgi:hypothetical protein